MTSRQTNGAPDVTSVQLLGEHHDDATRTPHVGELVHVLVRRHAAQRVAALARAAIARLPSRPTAVSAPPPLMESRAEDRQPEIREESDGRLEVADGDTTF